LIPAPVRRAFNLDGPARPLSGGTRQAYRIGDVVLKQLHIQSFETEHSLPLAPWLAGNLVQVKETGFRLARPLSAADGRWVVEDGWTAWTYVAGHSPTPADVPEVIAAAQALHRAVRHVPKHPLLDENTTAWGFAHRYCWQPDPPRVHSRLAALVQALYRRCRPLPPLPGQLIHGDLNAENIRITAGQPPGFIDFTPYWAPADFALAMLANWLGPRQGNVTILGCSEGIPHFYQLLLRAAVRMLLIVSELDGVKGWERAPEKRAAELVLALEPAD
jgi:hypothetical protein